MSVAEDDLLASRFPFPWKHKTYLGKNCSCVRGSAVHSSWHSLSVALKKRSLKSKCHFQQRAHPGNHSVCVYTCLYLCPAFQVLMWTKRPFLFPADVAENSCWPTETGQESWSGNVRTRHDLLQWHCRLHDHISQEYTHAGNRRNLPVILCPRKKAGCTKTLNSSSTGAEVTSISILWETGNLIRSHVMCVDAMQAHSSHSLSEAHPTYISADGCLIWVVGTCMTLWDNCRTLWDTWDTVGHHRILWQAGFVWNMPTWDVGSSEESDKAQPHTPEVIKQPQSHRKKLEMLGSIVSCLGLVNPQHVCSLCKFIFTCL